jgi:hypothetical protein
MKITILAGGEFIDGSTTKEVTVTRKFADTKGPLSANYKITGITANTRIQFHFNSPQNKTYYYYYIDDVKVIKLGEITLNEEINSSEAITANDGISATVNTVRTLKKDIWNTLCLPFNISKSSLETAWETSVELREYSSYSDNTMNFSPATSIEAGTPFLIKVGKTISNPTFESVTIVNTPAKTIREETSVKFVGTYSPVDLNTDGTHLFITTSGNVAKPASNQNHMKGLRAYIDVTNSSGVRLSIEDETTDIQQIAVSERQPTTLFNLNGQRLQSPKKGLIIKDGKLTFTK